MLVQHLTTRIHDVVYQLEHGMFLSAETKVKLQEELNGLVQARDLAREAMRVEPEPESPPPSRRASRWTTDY